jgi:hypothetical protein
MSTRIGRPRRWVAGCLVVLVLSIVSTRGPRAEGRSTSGGELATLAGPGAEVRSPAVRETGLAAELAMPDGETPYPVTVPPPSLALGQAPGGCISRQLQAGDNGTDVETLQWLLGMLGHQVSDQRGTYGLGTVVAVGAVQAELGQFVDGVATLALLGRLREACGSDRAGVAAVVSDSLLALTERELVRGLVDAGYRVVAFDAVGGSRMEITYDPDDLPLRASVAWRIRQIDARHHPSLWVISAGGNDALQLARVGGAPAADVAEGIAAVLEAVGSSDVVWLEPWLEDVDWTTYDDADLALGVDRALTRAMADRTGLVIGPWAALARMPDSGVLLSDGIHPGSALTRHLLVTLVMDALTFLP